MFCTDQRRSDPNPDPRDYLIRNPQIIRIQKDMWGTAWYSWYGMVGMVWLVWYGWHGMVGMVWLVWYGLDTKFLSLCQRQAILYMYYTVY